MSPKYLYISDLCERYRVKRWTVWNWVRQGKLPPADRRLGRPRWCTNVLDRWDDRAEAKQEGALQ